MNGFNPVPEIYFDGKQWAVTSFPWFGNLAKRKAWLNAAAWAVELNKPFKGYTTLQILCAPENAIFVWCTRDLWYPKTLAQQLGRRDLQIVGPEFIRRNPVVIDHAFYFLADRQLQCEAADMQGYLKAHGVEYA